MTDTKPSRDDASNGRVTIAVIKLQLDHIIEKMDESDARITKQLSEQEVRQEKKYAVRCALVDAWHDDHEKRLRDTEKLAQKIDTERQSGDKTANIVAVIASSVAATIGAFLSLPGGTK